MLDLLVSVSYITDTGHIKLLSGKHEPGPRRKPNLALFGLQPRENVMFNLIVILIDVCAAIALAMYGFENYDLRVTVYNQLFAIGQWSILGAAVLALHAFIVFVVTATYPQ